MNKGFYEKVGEKLLELRNEKELSQAQVANFLNITQAAYNRYEKGKRLISAEDICRLADFYGVSIDYIFGKEG